MIRLRTCEFLVCVCVCVCVVRQDAVKTLHVLASFHDFCVQTKGTRNRETGKIME